jgi:hypothetical protein
VNELIERLTSRLETLAETAEAQRDIDGVVTGTPRTRPAMISGRQSHRTVVWVAAAVIVLGGVGGMIALASDPNSPDSQAPIETNPLRPAPATTPKAEETTNSAVADTTGPSVPDFDAVAAPDPGQLTSDSWLLPTWLPDDYELVYAISADAGLNRSTRTLNYENSTGDSIGLTVTATPAEQPPQPWTRQAIENGYEASAHSASSWATIHASHIDATDFNRLIAETRVGTIEDVPDDLLITYPNPAPGDPVATYDADGVTVALYADGINGYYCLQGAIGVCPQTIPDGEIMTSHGGGASAGVTGSTTVTSTATGIVSSIVDRVEVEFIDGQRISVQPTDLTGRYDERFWIVTIDIELDEPQQFGDTTDTVRTVTAYDRNGTILHVDQGL